MTDPAAPADYVSARFAHAVTFRGATVDSIQSDWRFTLAHTSLGLLVTWRPDAGDGERAAQVRLVPWANVVCCEPTAVMLSRATASVPAAAPATRRK